MTKQNIFNVVIFLCLGWLMYQNYLFKAERTMIIDLIFDTKVALYKEVSDRIILANFVASRYHR